MRTGRPDYAITGVIKRTFIFLDSPGILSPLHRSLLGTTWIINHSLLIKALSDSESLIVPWPKELPAYNGQRGFRSKLATLWRGKGVGLDETEAHKVGTHMDTKWNIGSYWLRKGHNQSAGVKALYSSDANSVFLVSVNWPWQWPSADLPAALTSAKIVRKKRPGISEQNDETHNLIMARN